jgi:hypothetical protein
MTRIEGAMSFAFVSPPQLATAHADQPPAAAKRIELMTQLQRGATNCPESAGRLARVISDTINVQW